MVFRRASLRPGLLALLVLIGSGTASPRAAAHVVQFPRLVQLVFHDSRLTAGVGFTQHAGAVAARTRDRFDRNGDGGLDEEEQEALAAWLDERARSHLRLELADQALKPEVVERSLDLVSGRGAIEGDGFRMSSAAVLAISLRPGTHQFRFSDRPPTVRQIVPLRVDLPVGWELSGVRTEGEALPLTRSSEYSWQGAFAGEGGSILFSVTVPKTERGAVQSGAEVGSREASKLQ
ncbi:MAG: hypothetical protein VX498_00115 [Myxococcota bacterium]|nr:hypothetical protein [Myxococcota bacterium]